VNIIKSVQPIILGMGDARKEVKHMRVRNPMFIHYVKDMTRAKTFYTQAFGVEADFESEGWTTLNFGAIQLALHILNSNTECEGVMPHAGLNLEVDSIEAVQADIERLGGRMIQLREPKGGVPVRVATFEDSEGNGFELRQQP
jgi:predicted enzyme related to lactoylglutathione lyase